MDLKNGSQDTGLGELVHDGYGDNAPASPDPLWGDSCPFL